MDLTHKVTWHIHHVVTWQIKNVISPLSKGLWNPNLAGWWFTMREPHPQSHMTLQYHRHVTNKKRYISTFTSPIEHKFGDLGWGKSTYNDTWHFNYVVTWQIKNILSSLSEGTRSTKFSGWWLEWEDPTQQIMCHLDQAVPWQLSSRKCTFVPLLLEALS